ncbi:MAG: hypothetical protein OEW64_12370 [Gammaproteobacteria bacterium]|nr:hypothetical protein [Gammaproteobacteria bacterium]MDH5304875.1 hypothetical protein [Gammaproteobacteria bacterium]MDH5323036.1 hypothetical protein [Gammaproteobacteria bacterium]
MNEVQTTRRRFLAASLVFSSIAVAAETWLRGAAAWAGTRDPATLARFGRLLFPLDGLADAVYVQVMDRVLMSLVSMQPGDDVLMITEQSLNSQQAGNWFDLDAAAQIRAIENIQHEAHFAAVLSAVRDTFYNDPAVWAHMRYPGSSKEFGGYVQRGFDDINWLPEGRS